MYFQNFPYIGYEFPNGSIKNYKNISIRVAVVEKLKTFYSNLQEYEISEGETPEIIAFNVFGDATLHWAILMLNDITNVYNDWPKSTEQFKSYVYDKYRTQKDSDGTDVVLTDAQVQEFIEFEGMPSNNYSSYATGTSVVIRPHHFKDAEGTVYSYDTLNATIDAFGNTLVKPEVFPVSYFDYENEINENKRIILLPTGGVVQKMRKELVALLNE